MSVNKTWSQKQRAERWAQIKAAGRGLGTLLLGSQEQIADGAEHAAADVAQQLRNRRIGSAAPHTIGRVRPAGMPTASRVPSKQAPQNAPSSLRGPTLNPGTGPAAGLPPAPATKPAGEEAK